MKPKAILYTRVSTDEQNDGYSPLDQKERLIKYCDQQGIEIVGSGLPHLSPVVCKTK